MRGLTLATTNAAGTPKWRLIFLMKKGDPYYGSQKNPPLFVTALNKFKSHGQGRLLFIGTKKQASRTVREQALRYGQHYVNKRWLGGMLTNWKTVSASVKQLKSMEETFQKEEFQQLQKKERLSLRRQHQKLEDALGGIKNMGNIPDIVFIIDTNKEAIAVAEARKLNIPIVAVVDSNSNPDGIAYPIPANDDAARAVEFYCTMVAEAALKGLKKELGKELLKQKAGEGESKENESAVIEPEQIGKANDKKMTDTGRSGH